MPETGIYQINSIMRILKQIYFLSTIAVVSSCETKEIPKEEVPAVNLNSVTLTADQILNGQIKFGKPKKELIGLTIFANGTIEVPPQNKTVISAQLGGFVKSLNVLDGMSVYKGQTLLTIEHPDLIQLQQEYLEVVGDLEYLQAEAERQRKLSSLEAGTLKSFQSAKAEYTSALAKKSGLKAKLQMAGVNVEQLDAGNLQKTVSLKAPFNGVVTKLAVSLGAYANPTDHLLEVIDLKHAHAEVLIFEKDVKHLRIGQKVRLSFSTVDDNVDASIFLIGKEIGTDRTVKVHCHLDAENSSIAPGSYFKASIFTGEREAFCVPSEAIVELNGKTVVFYEKSKNGKVTIFVPEEVRVISTDENRSSIELVSKDRSMNEPLVINGAYELMSAILIQGEE
jgi:cobalt-zinc-cadmium efflux system membrane fusion protein